RQAGRLTPPRRGAARPGGGERVSRAAALELVAHPLAGDPGIAGKLGRRGIERREEPLARPRDASGLGRRGAQRLVPGGVPVAEPADLLVAGSATMTKWRGQV